METLVFVVMGLVAVAVIAFGAYGALVDSEADRKLRPLVEKVKAEAKEKADRVRRRVEKAVREE